MTRSVKLYFGDILRATDRIEKYTKSFIFDKFRKDDKTIDAVVRNLHVIGEATKNIPADIRARHGEIPWREIIAMRNMLIHEYFGIDIEILWKTVSEDIPDFKKQLIALMKSEGIGK